jgi:MFS family permease
MADKEPHAPRSGYESASSRRPTSAEGTLAPTSGKHDPYAAFRFSNFTFYSAGNLISVIGRLMLMVSVEWEIYARTNSATALGLVGLAIALPVVLLSLPAGYIADRYNRRTIVLCSQALSAVCSVALALVSFYHLAIPAWPVLQSGNRWLGAIAGIFERHATYRFDDLSLPLIYLILLISATGRTFGWAARAAFFPKLVPREVFANAVTWNSSIFQVGSVLGPAVGRLADRARGLPVHLCARCGLRDDVLPARARDSSLRSRRTRRQPPVAKPRRRPAVRR